MQKDTERCKLYFFSCIRGFASKFICHLRFCPSHTQNSQLLVWILVLSETIWQSQLKCHCSENPWTTPKDYAYLLSVAACFFHVPILPLLPHTIWAKKFAFSIYINLFILFALNMGKAYPIMILYGKYFGSTWLHLFHKDLASGVLQGEEVVASIQSVMERILKQQYIAKWAYIGCPWQKYRQEFELNETKITIGRRNIPLWIMKEKELTAKLRHLGFWFTFPWHYSEFCEEVMDWK